MKLLKLVLREVLNTLLWVLMLPFKSGVRTVSSGKVNVSTNDHGGPTDPWAKLHDPTDPWAR
jgi:hypothetical protein